jgi:hypothetical protein
MIIIFSVCACVLDDAAEGLGAYWGGSLIVYVECMVHPLKGIRQDLSFTFGFLESYVRF